MEDSHTIADLLQELFPICRSLTGDGNRRTLEILSEVTPLSIREVPCGKEVYDWQTPPEWNVHGAYIEDSSGERIVDFSDNNLHVLNYSTPVDRTLDFEELSDHLYTLPEMPGAIPYRTTYYERKWGFCLRHETFESLDRDDTYRAFIDSEHDPNGSLTYAEATIEGKSDKEYIISTYCCHPSLANDNLSGLVLATVLFKRLREISTYHSYRLIVAPETIGAITYLYENEEQMKAVDGGYVVTTVAGPGSFDYKESFVGDHPIDEAARWALRDRECDEHAFAPTGSDERQYSSPGFRIPTGTIAKDKYYEYEEYHTSEDDLTFVSPEALKETLDVYWDAIGLLERNRTYERPEPHCEFKLDRYDVYPTTGGQQKQPGYADGLDSASSGYETGDESTSGELLEAINWLMFGSDGQTSIFELAERSGIGVGPLFAAAEKLEEAELLVEVKG